MHGMQSPHTLLKGHSSVVLKACTFGGVAVAALALGELQVPSSIPAASVSPLRPWQRPCPGCRPGPLFPTCWCFAVGNATAVSACTLALPLLSFLVTLLLCEPGNPDHCAQVSSPTKLRWEQHLPCRVVKSTVSPSTQRTGREGVL